MSGQQDTPIISTFENMLRGFSNDIDGTLSEIQYCRDRLRTSNANIQAVTSHDADQRNHEASNDESSDFRYSEITQILRCDIGATESNRSRLLGSSVDIQTSPLSARSSEQPDLDDDFSLRTEKKSDGYIQLRTALKVAEDRILYLHTRNVELMAADTMRCNRCSELQRRIKQLENSAIASGKPRLHYSSSDQNKVYAKGNSKSIVTEKEDIRSETAFEHTPMRHDCCCDGDEVSCLDDSSLSSINPHISGQARLASSSSSRTSQSQPQSQLSAPHQSPTRHKNRGCTDRGPDEIPASTQQIFAPDTELLKTESCDFKMVVDSLGDEVHELQKKLEFQIVENAKLEATLLDVLELHKTQSVQNNNIASIRGQIALLHFEAEEYRIHIMDQEKLIKNLSVTYLKKMSSSL